MAEDLINKQDIYFPSNKGSNDNLITLINKTTQIISYWFSNTEKNGPLPFNESFNCLMPDQEGSSQDEIFSDIENLISNSFNPVHPGSLAHLDPPPLIISILGDLIAAGLNNNLLAYELSPGITNLEDTLLKWFSRKIGFGNCSGGIAASGGTLSNLNALIAARYNSGLSSDPRAVFLISEDAHSSFVKCSKIMGLNENNVIKVKTDNKGAMDINCLRKTIDQCAYDNKKIFSIVATFGTTIRGAIDPIKVICEICKEKNIWLHIDGSIGGIYAITHIPIEGLEFFKYANSVTINPQKILGITKTSSLLLVANIDNLTECFSTDIPYTTPNNGFLDRGELGLQGSRPAEVIKLWLGLRFLGISGIEDILKSSINKKLFFEKNLNSSEFEIFSGPLHIISFIPKGMSTEESDKWTENKKIELKENNFMLSRPRYKNKYFLRAVLGNYNTNSSHISELLNLINKIQ